jgi:hypothetical protein
MINFITAPAPRLLLPLALLGGGVLSAWSLRPERLPEPATRPGARLELREVTQSPGCAWGSAWNEGDVVLRGEELGDKVTLRRTFRFVDRCTWQATEVLERGGPGGTYAYQYEEHVLSCDPDSEGPANACTRTGLVTTSPLQVARAFSPLSGTTEASEPDPWDDGESFGCGVAVDDSDDEADDQDDDTDDQ